MRVLQMLPALPGGHGWLGSRTGQGLSPVLPPLPGVQSICLGGGRSHLYLVFFPGPAVPRALTRPSSISDERVSGSG